MKTICLCFSFLLVPAASTFGGTVFVEAEAFQSDGGWTVIDGADAKRASGTGVLCGAGGKSSGTASTVVTIKDPGRYHVWVRYASHPKWRGPFRLAAYADGRELGGAVFDTTFAGASARNPEVWKSFDVVLPEGEVTLRLSKHENKNSGGSSRRVDCVLLTMEDDLVPNHLHYGAPTFVRVTIGKGYQRPIYVHVFADHYHAPWYQHYSLARSGAVARVSPSKKTDLLAGGERTPWCDITPMLYQDSGAMLHITARHAYTEEADHLQAVFEFATAPDEGSIVRTYRVDNRPASWTIYVPPNLLTAENLDRIRTAQEIADDTGRLADAHPWPTYGKRPETFPFFVSARFGKSPDARLAEREHKTLDYFGFSDEHLRHVSGLWYRLDESYCRPDLAKMQARAADQARAFQQAGGDVNKIVFAELTDEPTGQSLEFMAGDKAYTTAFRDWLERRLRKTPAELLVSQWEEVRPVTAAERDEFPALYYYSQRFRTRALGDFMGVQHRMLEEAYGRDLPTLVNFSDGVIYSANFYAQGVDYFELLDDPDQNAIWGEDWSNGSSTYQCASYNVDLMRAAARKRRQTIGHHLIAYAGRKPWDVKLKATSELARGVKMLNNFCYGPTWATHEGGPYWRSSVWYAKPDSWTANAALTREVGAVEDLLPAAMPAPAKTALLYSSASDVWSIGGNLAYGFDRMHTWLALTHAQMPVDIVHESQASDGKLSDYAVCYLSGKHLTHAAAARLKDWVRQGGTLWLTAGAAERDEFNRPSTTVLEMLPADRGECLDLQSHVASGRYLRSLVAKDHAHGNHATAEVLSVKQSLTVRPDGEVLATFDDGSPALVRGSFGKGRVYCVGFLPALAYVKSALEARFSLEERAKADKSSLTTDEAAMLERSANPWEYPAEIRELLLTPVAQAEVVKPIECDAPLVDAVYMTHERGILIPLANYSNRTIERLEITVRVAEPVGRVESAIHGPLQFTQPSPGRVRIALPLENNDFVKLLFR